MKAAWNPVRSSLCGDDVIEYLGAHFKSVGRTLFVGNVGFSADSTYCPRVLSQTANMDFRFIFERRPDVPKEVTALAEARQAELKALLAEKLIVEPIDVCAADGAPVAGRSACRQIDAWLAGSSYTDVIIDATGMSRGTCFPVVKQLIEYGQLQGIRVNLVVADSDLGGSAGIESVSGDRGDWIHGFQGDVETDGMARALRLWVVQLKEESGNVLNRLFTDLDTPNEVCPIVPFPAADPLRGDRLLYNLRERWEDDWGESPLSLIYADESDPRDVYRSIAELHTARQESLQGANVTSVTILSPLGRRLPSIGMLLAAQKYSLPLYYLETVGYKVTGQIRLAARPKPDHLWCFRFLPQ
jgi:hypothetical protein